MAAAAMLGVDAERLHLAGYEAGALRALPGCAGSRHRQAARRARPGRGVRAAPARGGRGSPRRAATPCAAPWSSPARRPGWSATAWTAGAIRRPIAVPAPGEVEAVQLRAVPLPQAGRPRGLRQPDDEPHRRAGWRGAAGAAVRALTGPTEVFLTSRGARRRPGRYRRLPVPVGASGPPGSRSRAPTATVAAPRADRAPRGGGRPLRHVHRRRLVGVARPGDRLRRPPTGRPAAASTRSGTISLHDSRLRLDPLRSTGLGTPGRRLRALRAPTRPRLRRPRAQLPPQRPHRPAAPRAPLSARGAPRTESPGTLSCAGPRRQPARRLPRRGRAGGARRRPGARSSCTRPAT